MTPDADGARADLTALASRGGPWTTPLDRSPVTGPVRRSAVLLLFGLLEESDVADPVHADVDLLLTRRSDTLRHHPGQVAFPGGGIDDGETAAAAAVREAQEETGLDPAGVTVLGPLPSVPVAVSGNVVTPVLAWWDAPSALRVDGVETVEAFRAGVADLLDPAHRGTVVLRRPVPGRRGTVLHRSPAFAVAGHVVWGFTAFVLDALLDSLGWTVPWDREREIALPGH